MDGQTELPWHICAMAYILSRVTLGDKGLATKTGLSSLNDGGEGTVVPMCMRTLFIYSFIYYYAKAAEHKIAFVYNYTHTRDRHQDFVSINKKCL